VPAQPRLDLGTPEHQASPNLESARTLAPMAQPPHRGDGLAAEFGDLFQQQKVVAAVLLRLAVSHVSSKASRTWIFLGLVAASGCVQAVFVDVGKH
jgi:hypothetical protein